MATEAGGTIQEMAAATQTGAYGACLFTLDQRGSLSFTTQQMPGGPWQVWQGPRFAGQPKLGAKLACAGQDIGGALMLAMVDKKGRIWATSQIAPSGDWGQWADVSAGSQKFVATAIAAGEQGSPRGIQLAALDDKGLIWTCYQMDPGSAWSGWSSYFGPPGYIQDFTATELVLGSRGADMLMLVALADDGMLTARPQTAVGADWGAWSKRGLGGQKTKLHGICACQQGTDGGLQIWGLDDGGRVWTIAQQSVGGPWQPWQGPGFAAQPDTFVRIAAADQNNGHTVFLGVTKAGDLWWVHQRAGDGAWGKWHRLPAPLPS